MRLFGRKKDDAMSVDSLLAQANISSPTGAAPTSPSAPTSAESSSAELSATATGEPFRMPVQDVFVITGRGLVATGEVANGTVTTGMQVHVLRGEAVTHTVTVTGIEAFRKLLDTATVGANVGLLLSGVTRADVQSGDVISG